MPSGPNFFEIHILRDGHVLNFNVDRNRSPWILKRVKMDRIARHSSKPAGIRSLDAGTAQVDHTSRSDGEAD